MTQYSAHSLITGSGMPDDSDGYPLTADSVRPTCQQALPVQAKSYCGAIDEETILSLPVRGTYVAIRTNLRCCDRRDDQRLFYQYTRKLAALLHATIVFFRALKRSAPREKSIPRFG